MTEGILTMKDCKLTQRSIFCNAVQNAGETASVADVISMIRLETLSLEPFNFILNIFRDFKTYSKQEAQWLKTLKELEHNTKYLFSFVETPRKFIIAELSIRKLGSSSVLIILL